MIKPVHNDLAIIQTMVFDACGFEYTPALPEPESAEYAACAFEINTRSVRFRVAKITPTKTGQFVTLWKRKANGPIEPFDVSDLLDLVIVSTRSNTHFGQFIFPKSVLLKQDVLSSGGKGGKRAIRVYPPWDVATNKQAQKTQAWQLDYFMDLSHEPVDVVRAKLLYSTT